MSSDVLAAPYETATVAPGLRIVGEDGMPVQPPLSAPDVARYRAIFALQREAKWAEADRLIKTLDNKLLLGHVLYQRYVHPKYRSAYPELVAWLERYADLPGAERIHRLAEVRMPRGAKAPPEPAPVDLTAVGADDPGDDHDLVIQRAAGAGDVRRVLSMEESVLSPIHEHRLAQAEQALERLAQRHAVEPAEYDDLRRQIAVAYYADGNDRRAYALAAAAAQRSRDQVPCADWTAGLAAWRLGDMAAAARHFEALANSRSASNAEISAGAFWAARADLKARHPEKVNALLGIAAQYPRSFYGLLASRQLGIDVVFNWNMPRKSRDGQHIEQFPGVQRALALSAIGEDALAGQEIRLLYMHASDDIAARLLVLASRLNVPAATMQLGEHWRISRGATFDGALYPLPRWRPKGGFTVDRALVFAFMRQESAFDTRAKSRTGAAGLMQIMPETASVMAQDRSLRDTNSRQLYAPEVNIDLGQRYLQRLLQADGIRGNLILLAASYNAGPSAVKRWLGEIRYDRDPLLFIESIPAAETRNFVERVTTNFWIYEQRLGQDTPTLDTLAGGTWPYYVAEDTAALSVADDEPN